MYIVVVYCIVMLMLQIDLVVVPALSSAQTSGIACSSAALQTCGPAAAAETTCFLCGDPARWQRRRGGGEDRSDRDGYLLSHLTSHRSTETEENKIKINCWPEF